MTTMRVACCQVEARDLTDAPRALDEALAMCDAAAGAGADLVVLPEGTYPGYVLGSAAAGRAALSAGPDATAAFAERARRHAITIIVGLVVDTPAGLLNAAVHLGADGSVRNRAAKQFLWHFDRAWFTPGTEAAVADGIGILVCADARLPEVAAGLVERGARLLVNSTAWVANQAPPEGTNAQAEFLWRVRALEHGVPAAAATKAGTEAGVCTYAGRSQIVAPDGSVLAMAAASGADLIVADVDLPDTGRTARADDHHIDDHRVAGPPKAVSPAQTPPLRAGHAYCVVVSDDTMLDRIAGHGARVVVGPRGVAVADDVTIETLRDDAMLVPGPARAAAMRGCEFVAWIANDVSTTLVVEVARTRALENRVFVAVWQPAARGGPFIVGPSGRVLARTPDPNRPFAVGALCLLAEAASKEMAPGTDAWAGVAEL